jgi:hypothetical protein
MKTLRHGRIGLTIVAALTLLSGARSASPAAMDTSASAPPSFALYAQIGNTGALVPLNTETLTDLPDGRPLSFAEIGHRLLSADESTLVALENKLTIVVRDGRTGVERLRFDTPEPVTLLAISPDGTRLVTSIPMVCGPTGCPRATWRVFDTRDGRLTTSIRGGGGENVMVDREAKRLYTWFYHRGGLRQGIWPLQLAAYDLDTGTQIAAETLEGIVHTTMYPRVVDQMTIVEQRYPGIALSPDGTRIVVVEAEGRGAAIIDTTTLRTINGLRIHSKVSTLGRFARWLGLAPLTGEAKTMEGRYQTVVLAPDNRHIYLYAIEGDHDDSTGVSTAVGQGLKRIDLDTGEIVAEMSGDEYLQQILMGPDGRSLYVAGSSVAPWTVSHEVPNFIRRLDARTLEPLAEREFPGQVWIAFVPAGLSAA